MEWEWSLVGTVGEDFYYAHVGNVLGGARKFWCFSTVMIQSRHQLKVPDGASPSPSPTLGWYLIPT